MNETHMLCLILDLELKSGGQTAELLYCIEQPAADEVTHLHCEPMVQLVYNLTSQSTCGVKKRAKRHIKWQ